MGQPCGEESIKRLLRRFLDRESADTRRAYQQALSDFTTYAEAASSAHAVREILGLGAAGAQLKLERYKRSLVGVRDKNGKLIRGRGLSASSVNLRLTAMRSLVRQAFRSGIIDWTVDIKGVRNEIVKDVRGPGEEILNEMLKAAIEEQGPKGARDYAILRLAGELGLRRREIVGLDVDDVDVGACEIRVLGKGHRERETLSCTRKTADALANWLAVRPQPRSGFPFFTNLIPGRTSRISGPAVYMLVRRLGAAVLPTRSRKKVSPHRIRHTAITAAVRNAREAGLAREEVKKFSRHADLRMLDRYIDADSRAQAILAKSVGDKLV